MFWHKKTKPFFNKEQEKRIIQTIKKAENCTSGEIRVHIQHFIESNVLVEAANTFHRLKMDATKLDNGVLFFLVPESQQFAIIGDKGIDEKVPEDFWDNIKNEMENAFRKNDFVGGLILGIEKAGNELSTFFPIQDDDINELPDEISYS